MREDIDKKVNGGEIILKYVYKLNENNICIQIFNVYETEDLERYSTSEYVILDDEIVNVLGCEYKNGEFIQPKVTQYVDLTNNEILLSHILLDLQKIKQQLGVK